ncbi:MAG: sialidase family protein, partial [Nitrososphaera sp.]
MVEGLILTIGSGCAPALILTLLITAPLTLQSALAEGDVIGSNGATGDITGTPQKNPILTAEGKNVYILWVGNVPDSVKTFFIRSQDGGLTFTNPIQLANKVMSSPSLSASRNNVYLVWDDPSQEPYDVYFRSSTDAGTNFRLPVNLSDNVGFSRSPKIASYGSNVYVAWFDRTSSNHNELFLKASNNNGTTFIERVRLSDNAVDSGIQISTVENNVYVIWQDLNAETYDIMFAVSNDSGKSFR